MRSLKFLFLFALLSALLPAALFGQGTSAAGNPVVVNGVGQPMAGVTVAVCSTNPGASPTSLCSGANLATLYTDITIAVPCTGTLQALNNQTNPLVGSGCSNPGLTDGQGNVVAYGNPGIYWCEYSGDNIVGISVTTCPFPVPFSTFNLASPGPIGSTTPNTANFTALTVGPSGTPGISALLFNGPDAFGMCNVLGFDQLTDILDPATGNSSLAWNPDCTVNQRLLTTLFSSVPFTAGATAAWSNTAQNFVVGAPINVPGSGTGFDIVAGSQYAMAANDALKLSAFCNSGGGTLASLACSNYADESVAIQAALTSLGAKSTINFVDDLCGIQTWSVQPFAGPANNNMAGLFQLRSNCPPNNPHIISVDGTSTILIPTGLQIIGQGTAIGGATPQYGGTGNSAIGTYIRACNPAIYPCLHGGFVIQSGAINTTGVLSADGANLVKVTMTAKPFTQSSSAFNNIQQYRMIHIVGSGTITNNAAWVVSDCANGATCTGNPQSFHITAPAGWVNCAASCGTAYLDTCVLGFGTGGGNGVFGVQIQNLTVDGSFMPGVCGWVNAIGQELSGVRDVNSWDNTVYGARIDQSVAYNGQTFASSNSGPYGPLSSNFENVTCGLTGGCGCMGNNSTQNTVTAPGSLCSSQVIGTAGTVPKGTAMSCGSGTGLSTISLTTSGTPIDPCVNSNYHSFLFTGSAGQQGFGPMFHVTASMSDKSASGGGVCVPEMCQATTGSNIYGNGGIAGVTFGCAMGFYGIHGLVEDFHHEYALGGLCVGGDAARTGTFYYAYTNTTAPANGVITSGVTIDGGFAGATGAVEVDIGSQKSDAAFIGAVDIRNWNMQNGGSAIDVQNNVNGQTCKSYGAAPGGDYVLSYFFGPSTNGTNPGQTGLIMPQVRTTCSQLPAFTGNAFAVPLVSTAALSNYGVPVKADTSNAGQYVQTITTDTAAGIVMGVSFHPTAAGGFGDVVTTGVMTMMFGTSGTGNCAIGNFVIVDSTTNGHVKCTAVYSAGTVIGIALQAMSTTNTAFNVLVGLR